VGVLQTQTEEGWIRGTGHRPRPEYLHLGPFHTEGMALKSPTNGFDFGELRQGR
jgi:hypothetical protein